MKMIYFIYKLISKIKKDQEIMNNYYRKKGAKIGQGCLICTNIAGEESFLIEIGDNTTVSTDVSFITHDYSIHNLDENLINLFGKISIGNNCFIGNRSVLMYGISIGDNIIVAAGSVVTKSFSQPGIIIGGNPAKVIGTWDEFYKKSKDKSLSRKNLKVQISENPEKLIKK